MLTRKDPGQSSQEEQELFASLKLNPVPSEQQKEKQNPPIKTQKVEIQIPDGGKISLTLPEQYREKPAYAQTVRSQILPKGGYAAENNSDVMYAYVAGANSGHEALLIGVFKAGTVTSLAEAFNKKRGIGSTAANRSAFDEMQDVAKQVVSVITSDMAMKVSEKKSAAQSAQPYFTGRYAIPPGAKPKKSNLVDSILNDKQTTAAPREIPRANFDLEKADCLMQVGAAALDNDRVLIVVGWGDGRRDGAYDPPLDRAEYIRKMDVIFGVKNFPPKTGINQRSEPAGVKLIRRTKQSPEE